MNKKMGKERGKQAKDSIVKMLFIFVLMVSLHVSNASANYYYSLQLKNKSTGELYDFGTTSRSSTDTHWSGWIHCNLYDNVWRNSLKIYLENLSEKVYDEHDNEIPCRYEAGYGNLRWCDNADESQFTDIKYEVVAIAFHGRAENGSQGQWYEILDGPDYFYMNDGQEIEIFNRIKDEVKVLDLSEWGKHYWRATHYFGEMVALETLYLPNNDFAIYDEYMFAGAYNLTNIVWGENSVIREVGKGTFRDCFKLPQSQIQRIINEVADNSARGEIGAEAFYNCLQLVDVTIPARIRWIGDEAFCQRVETPDDLPANYDMSILKASLKTVTLTTDQTKTGNNEYWRCWHFEDGGSGLNISDEWYGWSDQNKWEAHYSDDFKWSGLCLDYIGNMAFAECQMLESVILGEGIQLKGLGYGVFADCRFLTSENVQAILDNYSVNGQDNNGNISIPAALFWGVNGKKLDNTYVESPAFTTVTIPDNVYEIGAGAFGVYNQGETPDHPSLKHINVSRGWRPDCKVKTSTNGYTINDYYENFTAFSGIVPNHITIHFSGDAAKYKSDNTTGYTTYITDGSEFQRLLTKDIYTDNTEATYDVEPQQHAIVRMNRTLKTGWNTVCLPFGATSDAKSVPENVDGSGDGAAYANSRIIQRALTPSNQDLSAESNFMIATYCDYVVENNSFRFVHLADYDDKPLPPYTTFLVRMDAADVAAASGVYTFENVDVNYQWNNGTASITPTADMVASVSTGQTLNGEPFNDGNGRHDLYELRGTFQTLKGQIGPGGSLSSLITSNDYYIQNNNGTTMYYQYQEGKNYGIKAFTGWFHYIENSGSQAPMAFINLSVNDLNGSVTAIRINTMGEEEQNVGQVYSLDGRMMAADSRDCGNLPKGIYVVNGKKRVIGK